LEIIRLNKELSEYLEITYDLDSKITALKTKIKNNKNAVKQLSTDRII